MKNSNEIAYFQGDILIHEDGTDKIFFVFCGHVENPYDSYFLSNVICTVMEDGSCHFQYFEKYDKLELGSNEIRKPDNAELKKFLGILHSNGYAYDGKEVFNIYYDVQKKILQ